MDEPRISQPYLEGLTTAELHSLAASFNLKLPAALDRNCLIEELLEYAPCLHFYQQAVCGDLPEFQAPSGKPHTKLELPEPAPLPRQYNITFVDILVRDPFWIFAMWEISAADRRKHEKNHEFEGYRLRVRHEAAHDEGLFLHIAQVGERDTMRYLNFPPENCVRSYIVELCAVHGGAAEILAVSHPFTLPKSIPAFGSGEEEALHTSMLILSGIDDIRVARGIL